MPSPAGPTPPEDRVRIVAGLVLVTSLAWAWVVHVAGMPGMAGAPVGSPGAMAGMNGMAGMADMPGMAGMPGMSAAPMPGNGDQALAGLAALSLMWAAMMVGMMLPSVFPNVLLFAAIARQRAGAGRPSLSVPGFVGGYLSAWIGFSLAAALVQTRLRTALLPMAPQSREAAFAAGTVLVLTGVYQWTRLKSACLSHCRSPLAHLSAHWKEGRTGPFRMGLEHGVLCLGCCWLLMALLFVGGVMNPYWVGGLALLVLAEKVVPRGELLGRAAGVALAAWGLLLLVQGWRGA